MTVNFRKLNYLVTGAVDIGDIMPTDAEMAIHQHTNLRAWVRASINYEQTRITDRSRGAPFNKVARSPMPAVVQDVIYNNKPFLSIPDGLVNPPELRSQDNILPSAGDYTVAIVGHYKAGANARYALVGNNADTSALTWMIGINLSNGRIEVKNSDNTYWTTGSGAFSATSLVPFMAVVAYKASTTSIRVRVNRGVNDMTRTGVTGSVGAAQKMQIASTGGDAFGRANPLHGGGVAEVLLTNNYIFDDAALLANVETVLGSRYGFAAP